MIDSQSITPMKFLLRSVAGFTGGLFGTLMLLIIFVLSSNIMTSVFEAEEVATQVINPIFLAVFLIMIFTGLVIANLFSVMLVSFADKYKYHRRSSILHQVCIFNVVLFFITLPFYIFSLVLGLGMLSIVALLHSFLSLAGSNLMLENIANPRYSLLAVYGTGLGILFGTMINIMVFKITGTINVLLFAFLPLTWLCMTVSQGLMEALYVSFYKFYGIDFLRTETAFGDDVNFDASGAKVKTEEEELSEEVEKDLKKKKGPKDVAGSEFLQENK